MLRYGRSAAPLTSRTIVSNERLHDVRFHISVTGKQRMNGQLGQREEPSLGSNGLCVAEYKAALCIYMCA